MSASSFFFFQMFIFFSSPFIFIVLTLHILPHFSFLPASSLSKLSLLDCFILCFMFISLCYFSFSLFFFCYFLLFSLYFDFLIFFLLFSLKLPTFICSPHRFSLYFFSISLSYLVSFFLFLFLFQTFTSYLILFFPGKTARDKFNNTQVPKPQDMSNQKKNFRMWVPCPS